MDKLYTPSQAGELLGGISKATIETWLSRGKLPRTKVGGRTMIAEADLESFVARCNQRTARVRKKVIQMKSVSPKPAALPPGGEIVNL